MNGKSMYDMDEKELEALITELEHTIAKLRFEKPRSTELSSEEEVLKDAKQLLAEKRNTSRSSDEDEITF
jgi:hypothetical protein